MQHNQLCNYSVTYVVATLVIIIMDDYLEII